jgi:hypothetical protein
MSEDRGDRRLRCGVLKPTQWHNKKQQRNYPLLAFLREDKGGFHD